MDRTTMFRCGAGLLLLALAAGCASPSHHSSSQFNWPWRKAVAKHEDYSVPPEGDARFEQPPSYPKTVMNPTIKRETAAAARRQAGDLAMPPGYGQQRPMSHGSMIR